MRPARFGSEALWQEFKETAKKKYLDRVAALATADKWAQVKIRMKRNRETHSRRTEGES